MIKNNFIYNVDSSPLMVGGLSCIYFIGIGGIGMSAIARYYNTLGVKVCGYDKTETVLTKQLQEEGIEIHFEDNIELAPKQVDFIVYTPAIPKEHTELNFYKNNENHTILQIALLVSKNKILLHFLLEFCL